MKVRHLHQTGTSEIPPAMEYGQIAVTKKGTLYAANEHNTPVSVTAEIQADVERTDKMGRNLAYDLKMMQLQQIAAGEEPYMMGGFIEGFYNTTNQGGRTYAAVDTANHRLLFNGRTEQSTETQTMTAQPSSNTPLQSGTFSNVIKKGPWTLRALRITLDGVLDGKQIPVKIYYGDTASSITNQLASVTIDGATPTDVEINGYFWDKAYYRIEVTLPTMSGAYGLHPSTDADSGNVWKFYSAQFACSVDHTIGQDPVMEDGMWQTKDLDLRTPVRKGVIYTHYPDLGAGNEVAFSVRGGTTGAFGPVVSDGTNTVTIGGETLVEERLLVELPQETNTIAVQIDGKHTDVSPGMWVADFMVFMY